MLSLIFFIIAIVIAISKGNPYIVLSLFGISALWSISSKLTLIKDKLSLILFKIDKE